MTQQNPKSNFTPITIQANANSKKRKDLSFKFNNIGSPNSSPSNQNKEGFCKYYMNEVYKAFYTEDQNYFSNLFRQHLFQTIQAYATFRFCSMVHVDEINKRLVNLPEYEKGKKQTLIFDLDETLIHCNTSGMGRTDVTLPIIFPSGEKLDASINIRPGCQDF